MITEYVLYSDERKNSPDGFLTLGGIVCTDRGRARLLGALTEVRTSFGLGKEVRWGKASSAYLAGYRAWIDTFFDDPHARYSMMTVDRSSDAWRAFRSQLRRGPNHDDLLVSVYYQFLLVTFGRLVDTRRWWVFPDAGYFSRDRVLCTVEFRLNRTYKKAFGPKSSRIIRQSRALNSKRHDLIQLADVLLGCSTYSHFALPLQSPSRRSLLEHYERRKTSTPYTQRGLPKITVHSWVPPKEFKYNTG